MPPIAGPPDVSEPSEVVPAASAPEATGTPGGAEVPIPQGDGVGVLREPTPAEGEAHGVERYKKRALLGGIALFARTGLAQLTILGGTVVLARHLLPAEFGAFAMIQFALSALTVFGDAGLAGALVQKKTPPTQRELSSVFFTQLALGAVVLVLAGLAGELLPWIWPELPEGSPWVLRALALNFLFTSARVVSMLLMERELLFVRVSILDSVSSIVFYVVASVLALGDHGIWALVYGVLAQGVVGLVMALMLRPWRPSLVFDWGAVRGLLRFGVPFQARTVLGLVIAAIIPLVGGRALGSQAVGYINWSLQTAFFPLTFVDIIARVSFPLYSRLQGSPAAFGEALDRSMRTCITLTMFLSGMFVGIGPELTRIIYSDRWLEAVPLLQIYAATITVGMLVNVLAPALDAVGKPRVVLVQMIFVTVLTWIAVPLATLEWGILGFVSAFVAVMVLGAVVIVVLARQHLPETKVFGPFVAPTIASVAIVGLGHSVLAPLTTGPLELTLTVVAEIAVFLAVVALLDRATLGALRSMLPGRAPAA